MSMYSPDPPDDPLDAPENWAPIDPVLPAPPVTLAELDEVFAWLGEPVPGDEELDEPDVGVPMAAE